MTSDTVGSARGYLPGLDGLRALSVLAVLAYHSEATWAPGGFLGVEVFFVVSGYLITGLLLGEWAGAGSIDLRRFWAHRARRLLPALGALLAGVALIAAFVAPDARARVRQDMIPSIAYVNNWWQIVSRQSYFAEALRPPLLRHLWSLAVEEQFYVVWPLLVLGAMRVLRGNRRTFAGVCVVAAVASVVLMAALHQPGTDPTREYYGTDTRAGGLLWGAALAAFVRGPLPARWKRLVDIGGVASVSALIIMLARVEDDSTFVFRGALPLVALFTGVTILAVAQPRRSAALRVGSFTSALLSTRALTWVGTRSYALYLWHWPIFIVLRPGVDANGWWVNPLRVALSFAAAELSYRLVEQPIRRGRLGEQIAAGGWRRGVGVVATASAALVALAFVAPTGGAFEPEQPDVAIDLTAPPPSLAPAVTVATGTTVVSRGAAPSVVSGSATLIITAASVAEPTTPSSAAPPTLMTPPTTGSPTTALPPGVTTTSTIVQPVTVSAIGDSVMQFAVPALQQVYGYQLSVDAEISRAWDGGLETARRQRAAGALGDVVVFHLGANGRIRPGLMRQVTKELADRRLVVILTIRVPRRYEGQVNAELLTLPPTAPNVRVVDWYTYSAGHGEWFQPDGYHLTAAGITAYVQLWRAALADVVPTPPPSTTTTSTTSTSTTSTTSTRSTTSTTTVPATRVRPTVSAPTPLTSVAPTTVPPTTPVVPPSTTIALATIPMSVVSEPVVLGTSTATG